MLILSVYQLRICETREASPHALENWLHSLQKSTKQQCWQLEKTKGFLELKTSSSMDQVLIGSQSLSCPESDPQGAFYLQQSKGPLLPIKRYSQFIDRQSKERIFPADYLLQAFNTLPEGNFSIRFQAVEKKEHQWMLREIRQAHFLADSRLEQWASKRWLKWSIRPWIVRALRWLRTEENHSAKTQIQTQHEREDPQQACLDKFSRPLFRVSVRSSHRFSFIHLFGLPYLGEFKWSRRPQELLLSAEELASLLPLPSPIQAARQLPTEKTAHLPGPPHWELNEEDRKRHLYVIGKTGMGKSTALLQLFQRDLEREACLILIDPHGDLVETALNFIKKDQLQRLVLLDPSKQEYPLAFNPLELQPGEDPGLKSSGLIEMFHVLSQGSWGPRLEHLLRNALLTLIRTPNSTLFDLPRLFQDRKQVERSLSFAPDPELERFWFTEFFSQEKRRQQEQISPILNKVGPLLSSPLLRNIVAQPKGKIHFEHFLKEKKIVLIPLSKGKLGEDMSRILGMVFISQIQSTLLKRAHDAPETRGSVFLYIDEFQNVCTPTLLSMLSESRKYGLGLTLSHQHLQQVPTEWQQALLGNVGSLISFRLGVEDAEILAPHFQIQSEDLSQLEPFKAYVKTLQKNQLLPVFRWNVAPEPQSNSSFEKDNKERQSQRYGRPRFQVEKKWKIRYNNGKSTSKNEKDPPLVNIESHASRLE